MTHNLKRPYYGLLIVPGIWRDLDDFSSGAVCMVLASDVYLQEDYIRDYNEFNNIDNYIKNNVINWKDDEYYPTITR